MQSKTEGREKSFLFFFSQAPDGESQPSTEVDLFISTEKIMVLNTDLKVIFFVKSRTELLKFYLVTIKFWR